MNEKIEAISIGNKVKVVKVSYPNLPRHAQFIGRVGTVEQILKTKNEIKVIFPNGDVRYCHPDHIQVA